ncbi:MAG TPA: helix-turn-helix transcriptional regulator [Caulobacteraceae bacterium]|nr:helix-turn-helix transcriptional regulator [Caulobacteraceae bacterium]
MSATSGEPELLDLVYDAAVAPELWPQVIERLIYLAGGDNGILVDQNQQTGRGEGLVVRVDPAMLVPYFGYYASRNVLLKTPDVRRFMSTWTPRILTDEDWLPKEALVRSEYYNDFLRPIDVHSVLMIRLAARDMNAVNLNIGRAERHGRFSAGDIDCITQIHPHLLRAYRLGVRFAEHRVADVAGGWLLETSPHAVFLVGADLRVRHANPAGERLASAGAGVSMISGRLGAHDAATQTKLVALVRKAATSDAESRSGGSMLIEAPDRLPLTVLVAPVSADRLAIVRGEPLAVVCVTDPQAGDGLPLQLARDLFGLTAAEARVAMELANGASPREIARTLGVSFYTVRAHLAHCYQRTGTTRQSELVALLLRTYGLVGRQT